MDKHKHKHYNERVGNADAMKHERAIILFAIIALLVGIPAGVFFRQKAELIESQINQRKQLERSIEAVQTELETKSHDSNTKASEIERLQREKSELEVKLQSRIDAKKIEVVARAQANEQPVAKPPVVAFSGGLQDWLYKLRMCESGGKYTTNTGNGFYGAYQFMIGTWNRIATKTNRPHLVGVRPDLASPADQDAMIIDNTILSKGGLSSQNPGCYAKTGISNKPPL